MSVPAHRSHRGDETRDDFYWTGDEHSNDEPQWMVDAVEAGIVRIEHGGTEEVCLVIGGHRFHRGSTITRADVASTRGA